MMNVWPARSIPALDECELVTCAGQPVTGAHSGFAYDNCWNFTNSQGYRADVTSLVSGNGSSSLSDLGKTGEFSQTR